jgi:drug/metabolite transporter (DMT)-like permease
VEPDAVEDEGHYEPPPPPPVPRLAPRKLAAVAAVVVGVLLMFAPKLLLQDRTAFVLTLGLLLTAGGAGVLVYLVRDAPPSDSGPDDGAVV